MVYTKTPWVNDSSPDIDQTNLNNIEDGIYKAQDFDSGEHIGDLPAARFTLNIEAAIAGKNIVPDTIVINNVTDEAGSLKIYGKDADVLILGDATHEGGDVSIYEDASAHKSLSFDADEGNLILGNTSSETASLKIYGKDANALILGDATHEGGDISVYRDTSGNKQFYVDADAASNAIAMSVYGGVVAQHYLTVGQAALNTSYPLYCIGNARISDALVAIGLIRTPIIQPLNANDPQLVHNIVVSGTDAIDHAVKLQIDFNDVIVAQATGDGAGGITNKAVGFFGTTPQVQQAHIADAANAAADPPTQAEYNAFVAKFNTLLADLEGYGLLLAS